MADWQFVLVVFAALFFLWCVAIYLDDRDNRKARERMGKALTPPNGGFGDQRYRLHGNYGANLESNTCESDEEKERLP
jgi:hypothetical protein